MLATVQSPTPTLVPYATCCQWLVRRVDDSTPLVGQLRRTVPPARWPARPPTALLRLLLPCHSASGTTRYGRRRLDQQDAVHQVRFHHTRTLVEDRPTPPTQGHIHKSVNQIVSIHMVPLQQVLGRTYPPPARQPCPTVLKVERKYGNWLAWVNGPAVITGQGDARRTDALDACFH